MRGWKALTVLLGLSVVLCGIGTWAFVAYLVPTIIPIGPLWPPSPGDIWLASGGLIAGSLVSFAVDYSPTWTTRLPLMSDAGTAASLSGAAIGALIATTSIAFADPTDPVAILISAAVAPVLAGLAWRRIRSAKRETRTHGDDIVRRKVLHETGTRVHGVVEHVHFHNTWLFGDHPLFSVTASYPTPSGRRRATDRLYTRIPDAPVVGGTVFIWFAGDGDDTENIDIVRDPDSIRDPDAAKTYEAPTV